MKRAILLALLILAACGQAPTEELQLAAASRPPLATLPPREPWRPVPGQRWQIQFVGEFDPGIEADVFDLDLFDTDPALISALHVRDQRAVCYINFGAWEDWRPDADRFPAEAIGRKYKGWPGERWLDIRRIDLLGPLLAARLDLCRDKGFDGVEPDNLDGYLNDTGFDLTAEDQLVFNRWLADQARERGLAVGLKNNEEQARELVDWFDFALAEDCFDQGWCDLLQPFLDAGKPVIAVEYTDTRIGLNRFCPQAQSLGVDALYKTRDLDAWVTYCP